MTLSPKIFHTGLAEAHKLDAGQKYRPSNGTEGDIFRAAWCGQCSRESYNEDTDEGEHCWILTNTMIFNVDEDQYAEEWQIGEDGQPICTKFLQEEPQHRCTKTPDMFNGDPGE